MSDNKQWTYFLFRLPHIQKTTTRHCFQRLLHWPWSSLALWIRYHFQLSSTSNIVLTIEINDLLGKSKKYKTLQKTYNLKSREYHFHISNELPKIVKLKLEQFKMFQVSLKYPQILSHYLEMSLKGKFFKLNRNRIYFLGRKRCRTLVSSQTTWMTICWKGMKK